jgi:hypothetical protein
MYKRTILPVPFPAMIEIRDKSTSLGGYKDWVIEVSGTSIDT